MRFSVSYLNTWMCLAFLLMFCCKLNETMHNVYRVSKHASKKFSPTISAVLVECPKRSPPNCEKKMMVNIRVSPTQQVERVQQYLILDEAFDQKRQAKAKLMSPYLIEVTRGEPVLMYPLQFSKSLRCDSCSQANNNTQVQLEDVQSSKEESKGFTKLKGQADSLQQLNKEDIKLVLNEKPGEAKGHLNDESLMNIRNLLVKAAGNQNNVQHAATQEEAVNGVKNDQQPISEYADKSSTTITTTNNNKNNNNNLIHKPPFVAKIHFETPDKGKRQQVEDEKNQQLLQELQKQEEKIKKDIIQATSKMSFTDGRSKRLDGNKWKSGKSPIRTKACDKCDCKSGECYNGCQGSGPCGKNCAKCPNSKISSKRMKGSGTNKQMRRYHQQRAHDDTNDRRLIRKNDRPIQEPTDESSNSDDTREFWDDVLPRDVNERIDFRLKEGDRDDDDWADESDPSGGSLTQNRNADSGSNKYTLRISPKQQYQRNMINEAENNAANYKVNNNDIEPEDLWKVRGDWTRNTNQVKDENNPKYINNRASMNTGNYCGENHKSCGNCNNCNSKGKCSQIEDVRNDKEKKDAGSTSLKGLNEAFKDSNAAFNSKEYRMPVQGSYQSSNVQFTPSSSSSYSNGVSKNINDNKKLNNFPLQRSPPEHNEESFVQFHSEDGTGVAGEDIEKAHLCPNKNCQLPHIPLSEQNEIDNLKTQKNIPIPVNYPSYKGQKDSESVNEGIDTSYSNYEVNENSQPFHAGYQDQDSSSSSSSGSVGTNDMNRLDIENKIYGSENNFGGNIRSKLFDDGTNGNTDDNSLLTERKISDSSGDDTLFMTGLNGADSLQATGDLENNFIQYNAMPFPVHPLNLDTEQKITRRMNKDNTDYYEDQAQEYVGFPDAFNPHQNIAGGFPKVYKPSAVLETGIKNSGAVPGDDVNCVLKSTPKISRETFFPHSGEDPFIGTLPSLKFNTYLDKQRQEFEKDTYNGIISDPNLNIQDKIDLMDSVVDPSKDLDMALEKLKPEVDTGFIAYDMSSPVRIPITILSDPNNPYRRYDKYFKKRSPFANGVPYTNGVYRNVADLHASKENSIAENCQGSPCGQRKGQCKNGVCSRDLNSDLAESRRSLRSVADVWYTVFNTSAPLPFLTTRVRIFRKRENSWWKIAPSITLTSLSGIYANANLSILFSSHVEMFNLDKPLILKDQRLIFPKDDRSGKKMLAVDNCKYNLDSINSNDKEATRNLCEAAFHQLYPDIDSVNCKRRKREDDGVYSIGDFGYFPSSMNILEECPNDSEHLCLNMLDSEAPAFGIKIQFPFRENALIPADVYQVRVTSIINDATTNGALLVTVMVVNEALISHEFAVFITNCPMTCGANNMVKRTLAPHVGEKFTFLLPMQESNPNMKYICDVEVKNIMNEVVATRQMTVEPLSRCLCVWHCSCYCIPTLASNVDYDVCQELSESKEKSAGFVEAKRDHVKWSLISMISIFLLLLMLFLGLFKAIVGCCIPPIDKWKYDYVQPMHRHQCASRPYRFFINSLFFLVLPFIFCCKCFTPAENEPVPSSDWGLSFVQQQLDSEDFGIHTDDEETILSQHIERDTGRRRAGGVEIEPSVAEYFCELYNDEEEERDTSYVLNALAESRESLKLMDGHFSEEMNSADPRSEEAIQLVRDLVGAKIVYRTLHVPMGNADIPSGQSYSIRGYFLPAAGPGYQFITHIPLRQHWSICPAINTLRPIIPPIMLFSKEFTRNYASKMDVLEASDLSVRPSVNAPCINVLVQDISMYHQPEPDDLNDEP